MPDRIWDVAAENPAMLWVLLLCVVAIPAIGQLVAMSERVAKILPGGQWLRRMRLSTASRIEREQLRESEEIQRLRTRVNRIEDDLVKANERERAVTASRDQLVAYLSYEARWHAINDVVLTEQGFTPIPPPRKTFSQWLENPSE